VTKFNDWLAEGEQLYTTAMAELEELARELESLEQRLAAKRDEVNQIATVIGKPEVEDNRRLSAEIVGGEGQTKSVPNSSNTIARALTGRNIGR
jgi:chromosome segregation ATPase